MKKILMIIILIVSILKANDDIDKIEELGDYIQILIPLSAYATTLIIDDKQGQYDFYKSFGATFVTTHILKNTVKEERPASTNTQSFPSGHTSASFQGASFIHFRYGLKYAIIPYLGAIFVGYSRVVSQNHYTHDVVAGAAIGTSFSWYFTEPYKVNKDLEIKPIVFNSIKTKQYLYGLNITW